MKTLITIGRCLLDKLSVRFKVEFPSRLSPFGIQPLSSLRLHLSPFPVMRPKFYEATRSGSATTGFQTGVVTTFMREISSLAGQITSLRSSLNRPPTQLLFHAFNSFFFFRWAVLTPIRSWSRRPPLLWNQAIPGSTGTDHFSFNVNCLRGLIPFYVLRDGNMEIPRNCLPFIGPEEIK